MQMLNVSMMLGHVLLTMSTQVRRLVSNLRMTSTRQPGSGSPTARESAVVEACQVLTSLVTEASDRKPIFLAEGGVIALMELLEERSTRVKDLVIACSSVSSLAVMQQFASLVS